MQSFENLEEAQNIELDYPVVPWLTEMFHDNIVFLTDHLLPLATARTRQAENIITKSVRKARVVATVFAT